MEWIVEFARQARLYDQVLGHADHRLLLATGLYGEVGSVLAEMKKMEREGKAYPHYRHRLMEELGDCLWYFVRLVSETDEGLLQQLPALPPQVSGDQQVRVLSISASLGAAAGDLLECLRRGTLDELSRPLKNVWQGLATIAAQRGIPLDQAAFANKAKTESRWPTKREFHPLFDNDFPVEERLPRNLSIEFLERQRGSRVEVLLRSNDINIGDRLTDNISDQDDYRFHDVFHMSFAVFLGWSPVTRALLHCKRKSKPEVDENQDGARALIIDEAVSAVVFSRAKKMRYFEGATQVDYDLLKTIQEFVRGFEVDQIQVWQWETAILRGFALFREMRAHRGGRINWNLNTREIQYSPLTHDSSGGEV